MKTDITQQILATKNVTHFVSEITYGALLDIVFEYKLSDADISKNIDGELQGLSDVAVRQLSAEGKIEAENLHKISESNLEIFIEGSLQKPVIIKDV